MDSLHSLPYHMHFVAHSFSSSCSPHICKFISVHLFYSVMCWSGTLYCCRTHGIRMSRLWPSYLCNYWCGNTSLLSIWKVLLQPFCPLLIIQIGILEWLPWLCCLPLYLGNVPVLFEFLSSHRPTILMQMIQCLLCYLSKRPVRAGLFCWQVVLTWLKMRLTELHVVGYPFLKCFSDFLIFWMICVQTHVYHDSSSILRLMESSPEPSLRSTDWGTQTFDDGHELEQAIANVEQLDSIFLRCLATFSYKTGLTQVRELAATTLAGLMKGAGSKHGESFRQEALDAALGLQATTKGKKRSRLHSLMHSFFFKSLDHLNGQLKSLIWEIFLDGNFVGCSLFSYTSWFLWSKWGALPTSKGLCHTMQKCCQESLVSTGVVTRMVFAKK